MLVGFELDSIDPTAVNKSDLYASALHEMMHAHGDDLLIWQREFGWGQGTLSAPSPVPEPSTGVLLTGILLASLLRNRSQRR